MHELARACILAAPALSPRGRRLAPGPPSRGWGLDALHTDEGERLSETDGSPQAWILEHLLAMSDQVYTIS